MGLHENKCLFIIRKGVPCRGSSYLGIRGIKKIEKRCFSHLKLFFGILKYLTPFITICNLFKYPFIKTFI